MCFRYVTGPSNLQNSDLGKIPHVYLFGGTFEGGPPPSLDGEGRYLVVYQAHACVLCFFVEGNLYLIRLVVWREKSTPLLEFTVQIYKVMPHLEVWDFSYWLVTGQLNHGSFD